MIEVTKEKSCKYTEALGEDTISRKAAIETIKAYWSKMYYPKIDGYIKCLEQLPSVIPKMNCPKDLNKFVLGIPFENTFSDEECEEKKFYGDCYHCWTTSIAKRDKQIKTEKEQHGYWIHRNDDYNDWLVCSECEYGEDGEIKFGEETNFCPSCGADMRGNKNGR